jgi:hypothetical protein
MKKYLIVALVCLSPMVFAEESAKLGQVENSFGQNDCNAPQVKGCGPCYKLCIEHNKSDRGGKDLNAPAAAKGKSGKSSAQGI